MHILGQCLTFKELSLFLGKFISGGIGNADLRISMQSLLSLF
jgi:hypothetical protein